MSGYEEAWENGYDDPPPWVDRHYRRRLEQHPDCRDPDHPGCDACEGEDEDEDEDDD